MIVPGPEKIFLQADGNLKLGEIRPAPTPTRPERAVCPPSVDMRRMLSALRAALGTPGALEANPLDARGWEIFGTCISRHRVASFLLRRLPAAARAEWPADLVERLQGIADGT